MTRAIEEIRRRAIQIAATASTEDTSETVYALCDDGTIWWYDFYTEKKWYRMRDIPQDKDGDE